MAKKASRKAFLRSKTARTYSVFISHSTKDRWIARQIVKELESAGHRYGVKAFLDERDIEYGDSISDEIRQNILSCKEFVVLLTRNSVKRAWVLIEIGIALSRKRRIVPVLDKLSTKKIRHIPRWDLAVDLNDIEGYINQVVRRARLWRK